MKKPELPEFPKKLSEGERKLLDFLEPLCREQNVQLFNNWPPRGNIRKKEINGLIIGILFAVAAILVAEFPFRSYMERKKRNEICKALARGTAEASLEMQYLSVHIPAKSVEELKGACEEEFAITFSTESAVKAIQEVVDSSQGDINGALILDVGRLKGGSRDK